MSDGNLLSCDRVICVRFSTAGAILSDRWILLNPVANIGDAGPGGQILRIRQLFDHTHRLRSPVHGQRRPGSQTVTDPPNPPAHPPDQSGIHLAGIPRIRGLAWNVGGGPPVNHWGEGFAGLRVLSFRMHPLLRI